MYQSAGENLGALGSHLQIGRGQAFQGEGMAYESSGARVDVHSRGDVEKEEEERGGQERWSGEG